MKVYCKEFPFPSPCLLHTRIFYWKPSWNYNGPLAGKNRLCVFLCGRLCLGCRGNGHRHVGLLTNLGDGPRRPLRPTTRGGIRSSSSSSSSSPPSELSSPLQTSGATAWYDAENPLNTIESSVRNLTSKASVVETISGGICGIKKKLYNLHDFLLLS